MAAMAMPLRKKLSAHAPVFADECCSKFGSAVSCISLSFAAFGRTSGSGSRSGYSKGRRSGVALMLSVKVRTDADWALESERWRRI